MNATLWTFLAFLGMALVVFASQAGLEILAEILPPDTLPWVLGLLVSLAIVITFGASNDEIRPQMPIHHKRQKTVYVDNSNYDTCF
jgi:hypothetical protein